MTNWEQIKYFLAVVKRGTVSAAASDLGVSHATVLRQIKQLEKELETRLFDHFQSGYKPTAAAEEVMAIALAMEQQATEFTRKLKGKESEPEGQLTIELPEFTLLDCSQWLRQFHEAYPKIELTLTSSFEQLSLQKLELDLAIHITNTPPEELIGRQLLQIEMGFYASKVYWQQHQHLEANEQRWLVWQPIHQTNMDSRLKQQEQALQFVCSRPNIVLRAHHYGDIFNGVQQDLGIGLLKKQHYEHLTPVNYPYRSGKFGVWLLTHPELRRSAKVQAFMQFASHQPLTASSVAG